MPALPDLTAKVKVDFGDFAAADVKARALGDSIRRSLGDSNTGLGRTQSLVKDFVRSWNSEWGQAAGRLQEFTGDVAQSTDQAGFSLSQLGGKVGALSNLIGPALIGVAIAVGAALSPIVVELSAFTVGLSAALVVMTAGLAIFGSLAAGIVALAAATQGWTGVTQSVPAAQSAASNAALAHTAAVQALNKQQQSWNSTSSHTAAQLLALQQAHQKVADSATKLQQAQDALSAAQTGADNPLQRLQAHFQTLADTLGKQAAPAAAQILNFVDELIAPVGDLASQTLGWFEANDRLGNALGVISGLVNEFLSFAQRLGPVIGQFLDAWLSRGPQWEALFRDALNVALGVVQGLLTNLLRLSDWFHQELPVMGPGVKATFDAMGIAIQGVGQALSAVLIPLFKLMAQHTDIVRAIVFGFVAVLGAAVIALAGVALTVIAVIAGIQFLVQHVQQAWQWVSTLTAGFRALAGGWIANIFLAALGPIGLVVNLVERLVSGVQSLVGWFQSLANQIRNLPHPNISLPSIPGRQSGGSVLPNAIYTVGETGPETLITGASGGFVFPNAGGSRAAGTVTATLANDRQNAMVALLRTIAQQQAAMLQVLQRAPASPGWPFMGRP